MRRKSVTAWFTAAISLLCLTACGGSQNAAEASSGNAEIRATDSENQEIIENENTENDETVQPEESISTEEPEGQPDESSDAQTESFKTTATIEETVLVDENDVKITATELSYTDYSAELNLLIENNSDKNLSFISGSMGYSCNAVNGYMVNDGYLNADVAAGKKANESVSFSTDMLMVYGIAEIADIQIGFDIQDEEYEDFYTGVRHIATSAADSYDYTEERYKKAVSSGIWEKAYHCSIDYYAEEEIYNRNDVRIVSEALMTNRDGEKAILVEIQNDSQEMVYGTISGIVVNGLTIQSSRWSGDFINPGTRRVVDLNITSMFDKSYWDAFGISDINEFAFSFTVEDADRKETAAPEEIRFTVAEGGPGVDGSGLELYNDNGIRIISKGLFEDPKEYGNDIHLLLLAENQSSESVIIDDEYDSLSINGFMTDCISYGVEAAAGKYVILDVEIQASSLEENKIDGIEDITDIEITFEIRDGQYNTIDKPVLVIEE